VRILQVSASALNQPINLKEGGNSKVSKNSKKIVKRKKNLIQKFQKIQNF